MHKKERREARIRLDREMRPFRQAGREPSPTNELLRAVRHVLDIPIAEIAAKLGVAPSLVIDFEAREREKTITLRSLGRMADAMGCKVVYGVVPLGGRTFDYMAEERLWRKVLETRQ